MTKLDIPAVQELLGAAEAGDYGPVFESFDENIIVENGPGAGPWRHAEGRDEFANLLLERVLRVLRRNVSTARSLYLRG
jgi:hypothetical protein